MNTSMVIAALVILPGPIRFQAHEIDAFPKGYQVAVADINGDGRPDVIALSTDADRVDWFENPTWRSRPVARTAKNIDLAPCDLDGDGRAELAVAAGFHFADASRGGEIYFLQQPAKDEELWTKHLVAADPVTHRIRWADLDGDGRRELVHAPIFGPGTKDVAGAKPCHLWAFRPPADPATGRWEPWTIDQSLTVLHGLWVGDLDHDGRDEILTASFEGIFRFDFEGPFPTGRWRKVQISAGAAPQSDRPDASRGSSEVAPGQFDAGHPFIAAIEPWHGSQVVVYTPGVEGQPWHRHVLDDTLREGHVLAVADFDGDGASEIVAGWRGGGGGLVRYDPQDASGEHFARTVIDSQMPAEGAAVADFNGDGRPDLVVSGGRANRLAWYENTATLARPADEFVDGVGVNVHLHYTDTVYWDFAKVKAALTRLGVRHLRDGLVYNGRMEYFDRYRQLAAAGIRGTFLVSGDLGKLAEQAARLGPALEALEGPNEVNLNHWRPADARNYQIQLWKTVRADAALKALPVVGLSYTDQAYGRELGDLSPDLDFGNCHPYPGGWEPENHCAWMHADLPSGFATARLTCGRRPVMVTEIGYTNALNRPGGHVPVSDHAAGVYLPRLFLNCFRHGVRRTYWYELFDVFPDPDRKDVERHFGLLENDGTTLKPAGLALGHLLHLLADPGPAFAPAGLDITISEPHAEAMLFGKRNGEYWLALWLPTSLWDHSRPYGQKHEEDPADLPCTVTFGRPVRRVTRYGDVEKAQMSEAALDAGRPITLTLSERVTLLRIEPAAPGK